MRQNIDRLAAAPRGDFFQQFQPVFADFFAGFDILAGHRQALFDQLPAALLVPIHQLALSENAENLQLVDRVGQPPEYLETLVEPPARSRDIAGDQVDDA